MFHRKTVFDLSFILVLAGALACGGATDPAEEVAEIRSGYAAELNGWVVDQRPVEPELPAPEAGAGEEAPAGDDGAAPEDAAPAAPEDEEAVAGPAAPVRQDVILDILISRDTRSSLPGVTVDVIQVDSDENPKNTWRVYVDAQDVTPGPGTQITHRVEDADVAPGDGFHVEVRHPVPPDERGEYREFQIHGAAEG